MPSSPSLRKLSVLQPQAAGIDIGADHHWVCVPAENPDPVRQFKCFTADLQALADWLVACDITTVAMESTGVYWIPLFQILESRGLAVCLVNARHVKTVPGRKSDVLDCQWLQQLHSYGLLASSFRPTADICVLRSYIRQRENLIRSSSVHIQRMQKALNEMNIQLHRVISDITGKTGMKIIRAILAGERDPLKLSELRDPRIKASPEKIAAALQGDYRAELLFILQQEVTLYETYCQQIQAGDVRIEQYLRQFEPKVNLDEQPLPALKRRRKKSYGNEPSFDLTTYLYQISGVDFTQIDGIGALSALNILSEVGLDPSRFPGVKHFTSWLGLCPGSRITGGKVKSSRTRRVVNRAANAFRMAAQSLANSQSALGAFYRRLRNRLGAPKAITATAHKLARIFYKLWTDGGPYLDPGVDAYEQQYQDRLVKNLKRKAKSLGFEMLPQNSANEATEFVS